MSSTEFVNVADCGLNGYSYYWERCERLGISENELHEADIHGPEAYVHQDLVGPLRRIDKALARFGYTLLIKEGLRTKKGYELAERVQKRTRGEAMASKLLNMENMPHSTGRAVDVSLISLESGKEVHLRNGAHDKEGDFSWDFILTEMTMSVKSIYPCRSC